TLDTSESIWRLASTFTNPNYFGFFLAIVLCFFFSGLVISQNSKTKILYLTFSLTCFALILFTGSRTGLVASSVSLITTYFLYIIKTYKNLNSFKWLSLISVLLVFVFLVFYSQDFLYKFERFSDFENIKFNLYTRYEIWFDALNKWEESPLIGNGPYKYYMDTFDSNYVLMLYRYGLFGITFFTIFFLFNFIKAIKYSNSVFSLGMVGVSVVFMISMISAIPFNFIQLGAIYISLIAIQDKMIFLKERSENFQ
ncbi:MAG: O-antigen ligase family protein, partial [Exiguobacterium chiriqhucha]|uniref:O-antigen ligase family protein n=1 Tax=Exiguobacterium chiriqhucha TaxID=1385984 RepID=UPI00144B4D65